MAEDTQKFVEDLTDQTKKINAGTRYTQLLLPLRSLRRWRPSRVTVEGKVALAIACLD